MESSEAQHLLPEFKVTRDLPKAWITALGNHLDISTQMTPRHLKNAVLHCVRYASLERAEAIKDSLSFEALDVTESESTWRDYMEAGHLALVAEARRRLKEETCSARARWMLSCASPEALARYGTEQDALREKLVSRRVLRRWRHAEAGLVSRQIAWER